MKLFEEISELDMKIIFYMYLNKCINIYLKIISFSKVQRLSKAIRAEKCHENKILTLLIYEASRVDHKLMVG